jgi:hypothetical protein
MQLFAHLVDKPIMVLSQIIFKPGELAQANDVALSRCDRLNSGRYVRSESANTKASRHRLYGTHSVAGTKPVKLLRMNRKT